MPPPSPSPHTPLPTPFGGRFGRSGGPTWVRREPVIVETVRAWLPVGLGSQGTESIDADGRRETRKRARATARRGVGCRWRGGGKVRSPPHARSALAPAPPRPRPLRAVPAAGKSGAATRLKAATCCIWAATAATGPRPGPCAAASRAAWCCRIFGREEGQVWKTQWRAAVRAP